ncbi:hypothetical protein, variant [Aphanomyces invadans]|nr:hypothetical protein, variant [Aphanomyces invadans]ETW01017.1 hypothetical protein, variant [Aphanomyces invadans]|eukprot:XP_008870015.1 hypothetical protein, variant [Aphanomyces invadans]
MYDIDHGLTYDSKHKGNAVPLKSATPRFPETTQSTPGPGAYRTEQFHGAFPTLHKSVTPRDVRQEHVAKHLELKTLMGIAPPPPQQPNATPATDCAMPMRPVKKPLHKSTGRRIEGKPALELEDAAVSSSPSSTICCSSPLIARLTPKNAYNGSFVRSMVATPRYRQALAVGKRTNAYVTDAPLDTSTSNAAVVAPPSAVPTSTESSRSATAASDAVDNSQVAPLPVLSLTSEVVQQDIALSDHVVSTS